MNTSPKAPWAQRLAVVVFTALAGILVYWLIGFIVDDIGQLKGPELTELEARELDPKLVAQSQAIAQEIDAITTVIDDQKARQALLRDSTTSSQQTMNQLLELQKQNVQNKVQPTAAERDVLAKSQSLFIANQAQYQALNEDIARRTEQQRRLTERKNGVESRLAAQREKAAEKFEVLNRRHRLRVAGLQLLFLIPLLLVAVYLAVRWRTTVYARLVYVSAIAILAKVVTVIHENFPTRYFKYVLLVAALAVVVRVLIYLIRATTSPKMASLLKQYREAYERFLCPICEYPIRRGPLRFMFWTRRSIRTLPASGLTADGPDVPYACPSCGSSLFEVCSRCTSIRHSLLLFCDRCGHEKGLDGAGQEQA